MKALGLAVGAALVLAACGSDQNVQGGEKAAGVECGGKESLAAEGSTAQENAMGEFIKAYGTTCEGKKLDYTGTGSGDGVAKFIEGKIDFAGSDSPLKEDEEDKEVSGAEETCGSPAQHVPTVFGPVAIAYNLDGVDGLALDGATIAGIFSGKITKWNDPAIAKLNDGVELPGEAIKVVFRSDESGTTDNFQKYLETAAPDAWTLGAGKTFNGKVGDGKAKSAGVSSQVKQTPGAITYVEWSFAKSNDLGVAKVANSGSEEPVELTTDSAAKAIDGAEITGEGNDLVLDLDSIYGTDAEGAYPLVLATYEIVCSDYQDDETAAAVKAFLSTALSDAGQSKLEAVGYVPVPEAFKAKLEKSIAAIK